MEVREDNGGRERVAALTIGAVATAAVAAWLAAVSPGSLISIHAPLAVASVLVALPTGAFMWSRPVVMPNQKWIHAAIMVTAFIGVNIAVALAFKASADGKAPHLYSLHSWFGLACLVLMKGAILDAAIAHILIRWRFGDFDRRRHVNGAMASFATGIAAILLGLCQEQVFVNQKLVERGLYGPRSISANFIALAVVVSAGAFVSAVRKRRWVDEVRAKEADSRKEKIEEYEISNCDASHTIV